MKLSIINYGTEVNTPTNVKREDDGIIRKLRDITTEQNMGKGAMLVSEVMHTGLGNLNLRRYRKEKIGKSVETFYTPYFTPFLMHHEYGGGGFFSDGDATLVAVGTNIYAKHFAKAMETPVGLADGYVKVGTFISENATIKDQSVIDLIQARRLMTLSIGCKVSDEDYRCSICGNTRADEESCEHRAGEQYDGVTCYHDVYNPWFKEYSAVYMPSDINAVIRRMDVEEGEGNTNEESIIDQQPSIGNIQLYETAGKIFASGGVVPNKPQDNNSKPCITDTNTDNDLYAEVNNMGNKSITDLITQIQELNNNISKNMENADRSNRIVEALSVALRYNIESNISKPDMDNIDDTSQNTDENTTNNDIDNPATPDSPDSSAIIDNQEDIDNPDTKDDNSNNNNDSTDNNDDPGDPDSNTDSNSGDDTNSNKDSNSNTIKADITTTDGSDTTNDADTSVNSDVSTDESGDNIGAQPEERVRIGSIAKGKTNSASRSFTRKPFRLTSISDIANQ